MESQTNPPVQPHGIPICIQFCTVAVLRVMISDSSLVTSWVFHCLLCYILMMFTWRFKNRQGWIGYTGTHFPMFVPRLTGKKSIKTIWWFIDGFLLVCQQFWFLKPERLTNHHVVYMERDGFSLKNHHKPITFPTYGFDLFFFPVTWLNEARTNIGLSSTMGFLNENDSLDYFASLEELSSGISFTVGFLKTLSFLSLLVGFFRGQGRTYLATPCVSWLKKTKYQKRHFLLLSALNLNGDLREALDRVDAKYILLKGVFMSKTVATVVQKVGFIWLKSAFLL